jgi:hypothetical protein
MRKDGKRVRKLIARKYAGSPLTNPLEEHARFFLPVPDLSSRDPNHPPYLMLRFTKVLSLSNQTRVLQAWDALQALNPVHHIAREKSRSTTPGLHVGVWELNSTTPYITKETTSQEEDVIIALDHLLELVKQLMVPKINSLTRRYLPIQFARFQLSVFLYPINSPG